MPPELTGTRQPRWARRSEIAVGGSGREGRVCEPGNTRRACRTDGEVASVCPRLLYIGGRGGGAFRQSTRCSSPSACAEWSLRVWDTSLRPRRLSEMSGGRGGERTLRDFSRVLDLLAASAPLLKDRWYRRHSRKPVSRCLCRWWWRCQAICELSAWLSDRFPRDGPLAVSRW